MFHNYHIYYDGEYLCSLRALSENSAIEQAYMRYGSASAYTGRARRLFRAERG